MTFLAALPRIGPALPHLDLAARPGDAIVEYGSHGFQHNETGLDAGSAHRLLQHDRNGRGRSTCAPATTVYLNLDQPSVLQIVNDVKEALERDAHSRDGPPSAR